MGVVVPPLPLTVWVLGGLDAHVGLALVHAGLPLAALLLHGRLGAVLGVDVGQVGRGVVVGLQGVVVLDLDQGTRSNQSLRFLTFENVAIWAIKYQSSIGHC